MRAEGDAQEYLSGGSQKGGCAAYAGWKPALPRRANNPRGAVGRGAQLCAPTNGTARARGSGVLRL